MALDCSLFHCWIFEVNIPIHTSTCQKQNLVISTNVSIWAWQETKETSLVTISGSTAQKEFVEVNSTESDLGD